MNKYVPYRIFHSHKDLFQFARQWFRVRTLNRDSIVLQAMEVNDRKINEEASRVFMTLYADSYITRKLHTTVKKLRAPSPGDSLYAKCRAIQSGSNSGMSFAARNPVVFKPKSKIIKVEKIKPEVDPNLGEFANIDEYLNPVYKMNIKKAYRDFTYSFYMKIDHRGKMKFVKFNFPMEPEFLATKTRVAEGIIDVYLNNMLDVNPGSTVGYKHASVVEVFVHGERVGQ